MLHNCSQQVRAVGKVISLRHNLWESFLGYLHSSVTFQMRVANFNFNYQPFLQILVPIIKRISWGFRNTPKHQLSDEYWPRKQQKTERLPKLNKTPIFGDLPFSLNCHNLAQNNPNFASWGCFGILRTSSWWWAQRFLKLMHPGLRNWRKRECSSYWRQLYYVFSGRNLKASNLPTCWGRWAGKVGV